MAEDANKEVAEQELSVEEGGLSLIDSLVEATKTKKGDESYDITKQGIQALITGLMEPGRAGEKITAGMVDDMISDIDKKLSAQVDAILHNETFQKLESSWRSLKFLVDRTNFRENVKIDLLNASKADLLDDFEDAPEITQSGLYKLAYTAEFGQFGGKPYGAIIGNLEFGPGAQDIKLLQDMASVSAMTHAPFVAAAGPAMFGCENFSQLPGLKDLSAIYEMPQFVKWNSFRESEDSRFVSLTAPHFLLRLPYGPDTIPSKKFNYSEVVTDDNKKFLWGNAAFAFAANLTESFANYRWCANIIGPQGGGAIEDLPVYNYEAMGETQMKIPTEVLVSERREFEMAEQGFMAMTMRKGTDNAAFFSANSVQKPKIFGATKEGKEAEMNYKLGTQLPYIFVVSRLAHYIKVIQRENIGTGKERPDIERELNDWIKQYVADMDNPAPGVRSRRPLRQAEVVVSDVDGDPGWYRVGLKVRPHFKYMGASFTLSLVGKLEKN